MQNEENFRAKVKKVYRLMVFTFSLIIFTGVVLVCYMYNPNLISFNLKSKTTIITPKEFDEDRIENGFHVKTGLIDAEGLMIVVNNCTNCHSANLVIQNRLTTQGWNETIHWMQETQNLWDLGCNQEVIVNYLVTNYPPKSKGRRMVLTNIDWYELED